MCAGVAEEIEKSTTLEEHLQPPYSFIVHHISLSTLARVGLVLVIGISSYESSLERSLAAASNHCNRRVTLRLGVERQRHLVRGRRPLLVRSSNSEDGAIGDASRLTVVVALSW